MEMKSHFKGHSIEDSSPGISELVRDIDCYIEDLSLNQSQNGVAEHTSHSSHPQQQSRLRKGYMSSSRRRQKLKVYIYYCCQCIVQLPPICPVFEVAPIACSEVTVDPATNGNSSSTALAKVTLTISFCFLE